MGLLLVENISAPDGDSNSSNGSNSNSDSQSNNGHSNSATRLLTLNRPEASNAFNTQLRVDLVDALEQATQDESVGAVVLTGSGKSFSAGIDLKELASLVEGNAPRDATPNNSPPSSNDTWRLLDVLMEFPKPLIMAPNGSAVGLGTTMLGFADLVIASENSRFKCPFTSLGVGAEAASTWLLPNLMGWQNAMWLLLSSEWMSPQEAESRGLVFAVYPHDCFLEEALAAATAIAQKDTATAVAIKRTMTAWRESYIQEALSREGKTFMELVRSKLG